MKNHPQNIFSVLILSMLLSACSVMKQAKIINTPTVTAIPSATSTPAATSTPSATPEPTMTPTLAPEQIEAAQKDQAVNNIYEYLNAEGIYSMEYFLDEAELFFGETELRSDELPLGIVGLGKAQFILLGNFYDHEGKIMHLYFGAVDMTGNRVAFDYNTPRTFDLRPHSPPPFLYFSIKSGMLRSLSSSERFNDHQLKSLEDWELFMMEKVTKPIVIDFDTESMFEYIKNANHGGGNPDPWYLEYDKGMFFRTAIFKKLAKFGDALEVNKIPLNLSDKEIQEQTVCLWRGDTFMGMESLNVSCPSAFGFNATYFREAYYQNP